jgi:uncharacterized protein (DUF1501 family)
MCGGFAHSATQTPVASNAEYRALVGIYLFGGHDGWNMAVPLDARYDAYRTARSRALALPRAQLIPHEGSAFGLHPALAPLHRENLEVVLNAGALQQPLTKALYLQRPDLRPTNVMQHDEAEKHWGLEGEMVAMLTASAKATSGVVFTPDHAALHADTPLRVDRYFAHLTSDLAGQLHRAARVIETREVLGHHHQAFMVTQPGYDTHEDQVPRQARLYADLAASLAAFQAATAALGLARHVTAFTLSEFGRSYKANRDGGTEHAWGNNHLVIGGAAAQATRGVYPTPVLGGPDDVIGDGRWLPSMSIAQYLAPIARWYGVQDLTQVFPQGNDSAAIV